MNTNASVFYGFLGLTASCCLAWYIERKKFMIEKEKKIEESRETVKKRQQKLQQQNNLDNSIDTYKPYDETNIKRSNITNNNNSNNNDNLKK